MIKKIIKKIGSAMNANKKEDRNPKRPSFLMLMMNKLFVIIPIKNAKDDKNKSYVLPSIILAFIAIITNAIIEYFTGESIVITAVMNFISVSAGLIGLFGFIQPGK